MVYVPQLRKSVSVRGPLEQCKTFKIKEQIWPLVRQLEVDGNSCARLAFTEREDRESPCHDVLGL